VSDAPLSPEEDARVMAALDQLAAALTEIHGARVHRPIVVLAAATEGESECLTTFTAGCTHGQLPYLLLRALQIFLTRPPDVARQRPT
jgi:hypothetical protein